MAKGKKKNPFYDHDLFITVPHSTDLKEDEDIERDEIAHAKGAGKRTAVSVEFLRSLMHHAYIMAAFHERVMLEVLDRENEKSYEKRIVPFDEREPVTFTMSWNEWVDWDWSWMAMSGAMDTEAQKNKLVQKYQDVLLRPERYETWSDVIRESKERMALEITEREKNETPEEKKEREKIHQKFFSQDS